MDRRLRQRILWVFLVERNGYSQERYRYETLVYGIVQDVTRIETTGHNQRHLFLARESEEQSGKSE